MSDEQRRQDLAVLEEFRADSVRFADEEWFKCLIPKQVHTSLQAAESICRSFHTDTSQLAAG